MRRRQFIALAGGAAAAWPLAARAQQAAKRPIVGFLGDSTSVAENERAAAFARRLHDLGWIEGRTIAIEYPWADARSDRLAEIAAEFSRLKVDIIVTGGTPATIAAKQAAPAVPIVFAAAGDPVGVGLVASLARPGVNVTGLSVLAVDLAGKRLGLLREAISNLGRLAIMVNVGNPLTVLELGELQAAARLLGIQLDALEIRRSQDIAHALDAVKGRADALLCLSRPANAGQPAAHQHLGAGCALAGDARLSGVHRSGRPDVLRTELRGFVPARR
jgi:putative tryptophan/tyrosine transport system substrate-binding protein